MSLTESIRTLLHSLGPTSGEVADSLRKRGITGFPGHCQTCPIAVLILREYPGEVTPKNLTVRGDAIELFSGTALRVVRMPQPVRHFLVAFDLAEYPDMIRRERLVT